MPRLPRLMLYMSCAWKWLCVCAQPSSSRYSMPCVATCQRMHAWPTQDDVRIIAHIHDMLMQHDIGLVR